MTEEDDKKESSETPKREQKRKVNFLAYFFCRESIRFGENKKRRRKKKKKKNQNADRPAEKSFVLVPKTPEVTPNVEP